MWYLLISIYTILLPQWTLGRLLLRHPGLLRLLRRQRQLPGFRPLRPWRLLHDLICLGWPPCHHITNYTHNSWLLNTHRFQYIHLLYLDIPHLQPTIYLDNHRTCKRHCHLHRLLHPTHMHLQRLPPLQWRHIQHHLHLCHHLPCHQLPKHLSYDQTCLIPMLHHPSTSHGLPPPIQQSNHCAFHPSAITMAISACAFQSVLSTDRQFTVAISACVSSICVSNHSSLCVPPATIRTCAFYFYTSERKSFLQSTQSPTWSQSVLVDSMVCIPLCASILFVLPAGNHPNAISACVSYARIRNRNSKYAPPVGHHRVALSLSAPVSKNHCAFHPSASISHHHRNQCLCVPVCAFHPPAIHRCNQCVCVQHPRQQPQFTVCSTCHNQNLCFLFLYQWTKIIFAVHTIANLIAISACGFHGVHSIMCFHFVRSACWQSSQCNQCLCVLCPYQKPQFKVCSIRWPSPGCAFYFCTSEQESLCIPPISHHHRSQCLCVPVCAIHPPAIHRCNQCVCVQHPRQQP